VSLFDSSLWDLSYIQNFVSTQIQLTQFPIPSFTTGLFNSEVIKIKLTSNNGYFRRFGAVLNHCVTLDNGEVNIVDRYSLYLSDSRIINLRPFSPYFLRIDPARTLEQLTVSIYQFTGSL
jgi:hypothetical protein